MNTDGGPSPRVIDRRSIARRGFAWVVCPLLAFGAGRASAPGDRDADLVQVTSIALDRGQEFWAQRVGPTWRDARVVLIDRPTPTPCGLAGPSSGPFYCTADARIYLDLSFLGEIRGQAARAYVIAHELAHHVQVVTGDATRGIERELGADCLAGLWLADEARGGKVDELDLEAALEEAEAVGDDRLCPGCSPEEWSHGSGRQRADAFARGVGGGPC